MANETQPAEPTVPSTEPQIAASAPVIDPNAKIDEITAIQDSIDRLSLAMFEALRGLRDAVAPESGNASANTESNSEPDFEEFWQSYRNNDSETVAAVKRANNGIPPQKREDYVRVFQKLEREKDAELVARLATTVLQKSSDIDELVAALSGMDRTRTEQMQRIEELIRQNQEAEKELEEVHALAKEHRDQVRKTLQANTCVALAIEEYND